MPTAASPQALLQQYFGPLDDLPCWHVTAEFGSWLSLNFGQPRLEVREAMPDSKSRILRRRAAQVVGDHLLWIEMGTWELRVDGRRAFHSEQGRTRLRRAASTLDGQKILSVTVTDQMTEWCFDFGAVLRVRPHRDAEPDHSNWHVYSGSLCLTQRADGRLEHGRSDAQHQEHCRLTEPVRFVSGANIGIQRR